MLGTGGCRVFLALLLALWLVGTESALPFGSYYPKHLLANKLKLGKKIKIDGKLDDPAWGDDFCSWYNNSFVDITKHNSTAENTVPIEFQSKVGLRWDSGFLYVGAVVNEPFVYGTITGHNKVAPYHDNDFEVFIDVSGTTEYYKEYEMNFLNSTYDVNWGVPDGDGLSCDKSAGRDAPYLPVCVNTSFPGYTGNWTMRGSNGSGLRTATYAPPGTFSKYLGGNFWSVEIAFPIRQSKDPGASHGGLLDTDSASNSYSKYDPNLPNIDAPNLPRYWWIDFARAEHPRRYTYRDQFSKYCPLNCSNLSGFTAALKNPNGTECVILQRENPTLLGSDPVYGCYWEWVFQDLGPANAYMHRPQEWAIVEFVDNGMFQEKTKPCKNIEFVGRHAVKVIHSAQKEFFALKASFADTLTELLSEKYCSLPSCNLDDLKLLEARDDVFVNTSFNVTANATHLTKQCTSRPCYTATVDVQIARDGQEEMYSYSTSVNENLLVKVDHSSLGRDKVKGYVCL